MAKTGSPVKAKMPKVRQHNKLTMEQMTHRSAGDFRVFLDLPFFGTYGEAQAVTGTSFQGELTKGRFDYSALQGSSRDEHGVSDDLKSIWAVLEEIGASYNELTNVPANVAAVVDESQWLDRILANIAKCAGASARCAVIDDGTENPVVIENYVGPGNAECFSNEGLMTPIQVFYPSLCKVGDSSFFIERDRDTGIASGVKGSMPVLHAQKVGLSKLVNRTRRNMVAEAARKVTKVHSLNFITEAENPVFEAAAVMPEAGSCWCGEKHRYSGAFPVTVTRTDGSVVTVDPHDGFWATPERLRIAGVEYLQAGSKRETRPADEAALQWATYGEMLDLVPEVVRETAAFLLFLKSQDSLATITEMEQNERDKGIREQNKAQERRLLKPGEIANEWKELLSHTEIPFTRYYVQQALVALAQARDVLYAQETLDFSLETPTAEYMEAHKAMMSPTMLSLLNLHPGTVQTRATGKVSWAEPMMEGDNILLSKMVGDRVTNTYRIKIEGLSNLVSTLGPEIKRMVDGLLEITKAAPLLTD